MRTCSRMAISSGGWEGTCDFAALRVLREEPEIIDGEVVRCFSLWRPAVESLLLLSNCALQSPESCSFLVFTLFLNLELEDESQLEVIHGSITLIALAMGKRTESFLSTLTRQDTLSATLLGKTMRGQEYRRNVAPVAANTLLFVTAVAVVLGGLDFLGTFLATLTALAPAKANCSAVRGVDSNYSL